MARKYFTDIREEEAVEFRIDIPDLEEYKNAWLVICNNARINRQVLYKVSNNDADSIYVTACRDERKNVRDWLSLFGEIQYEEETVAVFIDITCEYDNFDKDYVDSEYILGETD